MTDTDTDAGPSILVDYADSVLRLTLNRPDKGNALRQEDCAALLEEVEAVDGGEGVRAILIRAEGRNFCAGADLVTANAGDAKPRVGHLTRSLESGAHRLVAAIWNCPVPTVSVVQGKAMGLGLHVAIACDFTIAAEDATFTEPFCRRGFSVDSGGSFILPRLIGPRRARQMLFRGVTVDAATAVTWGLIDEAVTPGALNGAGEVLARELSQGPTFSLSHTKRLLNDPPIGGLDGTLTREAASVEATLRSADFKEGLRAFVERRDPSFSGA
ncbi:enoyl-CoA hydratase/isomerase family protein [Mycolicibacterium stellerae]|uniref:enoyl-CoA hydratase/isomerase family protein n=1 Tax=Mycolicibacterium stellerae TaxID=2358193 RepID=UPI000F0B9E6A|nr:enoyl-CoA hydratase-related protein [Mycolicibacterium stellerae]